MLMSLRGGLSDELARFMTRAGGLVVAVAIALQALLAQMTMAAQPSNVFTTVMGDSLYRTFVFGWLTTALLLAFLGLVAVRSKGANALIAIFVPVVAFLNIVSTVMVRDGVRDITLRIAGFDVWDRRVASNWSVIGLFLVLLVTALVIIAWLISVVGKAKRVEESYV